MTEVISRSPSKNPIEERKNYNGIDLIKFICSIFVFTVHISVFGKTELRDSWFNVGLSHCLCRIAVPFFFVASSFFLFAKMEPRSIDKDRVKKYCFRLLILYGIWVMINVLGGNYHLWYLKATVVAVVLLSILLYLKVKPVCLWILAGILYAVGLLGDAYAGLGEKLMDVSLVNIIVKVYTLFSKSTKNGFFMGFIFVLMGYTLAHSKGRMSKRVSFAGFAVSMGGLFAEFYFLRLYDIPSEYNMYVMLVPAVYFLFKFALSLELRDRPIYKRLRGAGTLIYFSHLFVNHLVVLGINIFKKFTGIELIPFRYVISLTCVLVFAFAAEALSGKEKFKWLKMFY